MLLAVISALAFYKKWKLVLLLLLFIVTLNCYLQIFPIHTKTNSYNSNTFRVVTYNISPQVDSTQYDQWQRDMLDEIKRLHPDVLCLQEFQWGMKWLEKEIRTYYSYSEEIIEDRKHARRRIYSRYPMTCVKRYSPTEDLDTTGITPSFLVGLSKRQTRQPFVSANIHLPSGDSVTVFCCHLQSNGYSTIRRSMKESESWLSGIGRYHEAIKSASVIRYWEAKNLRHALDSIGNNHSVIVAGDFNDFNQSTCLNTIQGNVLQDAWWEGGNGFGFTYYGFGLTLRLDHILYNEKLKLQDVEVGSSELSDHRSLIADFTITRK